LSNNIFGCPAPKPITLVQRLRPFEGKTVTVFTPGFPDLTKTVGKLTENTAQSFTVGSQQVLFNTSFFIVLPAKAGSLLFFTVSCTAEELGIVDGKLVQVGKNFVELVQSNSKSLTLFPLNLFTQVECEPDHEE
jgi:hypothetical protein